MAKQTQRPGSAAGTRFMSVQLIGSGGMGVIYGATDTWSGQPVALKMAHPHLEKRRVDDQLSHEALMLSLVNNRRVCGLLDVLKHGGRVCLVLERLDGESLQARLASRRMTNRELLDIAIQLTHALGAIHAAGVVHQDIKPANVFITSAGVVKVLDFGIAALSGDPSEGSTRAPRKRKPTVLGSPNYISPDRLMARPADPSSDLFSLGAVLYEMATGVMPFAAASPGQVLLNVLDARPTPVQDLAPDRPAGLGSLLRGLFARTPQDRVALADVLHCLRHAASLDTFQQAPGHTRPSTRVA